MKKIILFVCLLGIFAGTHVYAQTPACGVAQNMMETMWSKFGEFREAMPRPEWDGKKVTAVNLWNAAAANGWATLGPRALNFDDSENGNIMGQSNRTFVTPPAFDNTIRIKIKKTDGKAKTGVTICTKTKDGSIETVHSYTFPNDNDPQEKIFTISNAKRKVISVTMRNYSVGNKFTYKITTY